MKKLPLLNHGTQNTNLNSGTIHHDPVCKLSVFALCNIVRLLLLLITYAIQASIKTVHRQLDRISYHPWCHWACAQTFEGKCFNMVFYSRFPAIHKGENVFCTTSNGNKLGIVTIAIMVCTELMWLITICNLFSNLSNTQNANIVNFVCCGKTRLSIETDNLLILHFVLLSLLAICLNSQVLISHSIFISIWNFASISNLSAW